MLEIRQKLREEFLGDVRVAFVLRLDLGHHHLVILLFGNSSTSKWLPLFFYSHEALDFLQETEEVLDLGDHFWVDFLPRERVESVFELGALHRVVGARQGAQDLFKVTRVGLAEELHFLRLPKERLPGEPPQKMLQELLPVFHELFVFVALQEKNNRRWISRSFGN